MIIVIVGLTAGGPRMFRNNFGAAADDMAVFGLLFVGAAVVITFGMELCLMMALRGVARDFGDFALGGGFVAFLVTWVVIQILGVGAQFYIEYLREEAFAQMFAGPAMGGPAMGGVQAGVMSLEDVQNIIMVLAAVSQLVVMLGMFIWMMTLLSRVANLIPVGGYGGRRYPPPYRGGPY